MMHTLMSSVVGIANADIVFLRMSYVASWRSSVCTFKREDVCTYCTFFSPYYINTLLYSIVNRMENILKLNFVLEWFHKIKREKKLFCMQSYTYCEVITRIPDHFCCAFQNMKFTSYSTATLDITMSYNIGEEIMKNIFFKLIKISFTTSML